MSPRSFVVLILGLILSAPAGAEETCHQGEPFALTFCSADCRCGQGEGDCDNDAECQPGLRCAKDVGPSYGAASYVDVCEPAAPPPPPGGSPPQAKQVGQPCAAAAECLDKLCVVGGSGMFCSRLCSTSGDCPGGFSCISGVCQPRSTSLGPADAPGQLDERGFGAPCVVHSSCKSGLCAPDGFCSKYCGTADEGCPLGSVCQPTGHAQAICVASGDEQTAGGCAIQGGAGFGPLAVPVLLALLCLYRRRENHGTSSERRRRSSR